MQLLLSARDKGFTRVSQLGDAGLSLSALEKLADADAFRSIGLNRREALWEVSALSDRPVGIFTGQVSESDHEEVQLPSMALSEHVVQDYASTSLSLKAHPVSFVRRHLYHRGILPTNELNLWPDGTLVRVSGLVLVRQRPGTASGICFITIEDETGTANLVVFQKLFDQYRSVILQSKLLMVEGKLQREGEVTHVVVQRCFNLNGLLAQLTDTKEEELPISTLSRADERDGEVFPEKGKEKTEQKLVQAELFANARNFK